MQYPASSCFYNRHDIEVRTRHEHRAGLNCSVESTSETLMKVQSAVPLLCASLVWVAPMACSSKIDGEPLGQGEGGSVGSPVTTTGQPGTTSGGPATSSSTEGVGGDAGTSSTSTESATTTMSSTSATTGAMVGTTGRGFGTTNGGGGTSTTSAASTDDSSTTGGTTTGGSSTNCEQWPTATGDESVSSTISVSNTYDGELKRFSGSGPLGTSGQSEDQGPLFDLAPGATLRNVILGNPAADGVHCAGDCTLENVWWEDVGEDAATFRGSSDSSRYTVTCGGARMAEDKIFQHNGAGTLTIQNFVAETFGKVYRSCGNCSTQYERHVVLDNVTAQNGSTLAGINTNYGDTATFSNIVVYGNITICQRYTGNNTGAEPFQTGSGADGQYCLYQDSDIENR